ELVIHQPLAVRRPVVIGNLAVAAGIYFHRLLLGDVGVPEIQPLVGPGDLLAIGRPCGREHEAFVAAGDLLFLSQAILRHDVNLLFSSSVGNVGNPASVGRPGNLVLANSGCAGQVADTSFFGRSGEDVATGREHSALAVGSDVEVGDQAAHVVPALQ